ncbi:PLP-dependent aminotransferase family protein [Streptomyces aurantiacus]|uniref:MocR-like pyridoxine biosynthesis transcription factor PdxR n=1 Tax=Streptomyces aurantiacus TaxID=47760 RepID=UPI003323E2E1
MEDSWATLGVDLHLETRGAPGSDGSGAPRSGVRRGLTDALREAVRGGRLAPGTRLPSSRSLAADLGIARNTVADAYADLVAEGWLTARQGSGTRVAERDVPRPTGPARPQRAPGGLTHDLKPGSPDLSAFPRAEWLKAARRALAHAPNEAFGYSDRRGRIELRTALAAYLARARGVHADPDRVVVCAGFVGALRLLSGVLHDRLGVRDVAVDSYGLNFHWGIMREAGLRTRPLGLDELGTRTQELAASGAGAVQAALLTPSHQFPMGVPLSPSRRADVVDWARRAGGLILEDDYDGEFRYDRQPVGALQGLDPDRVVYLGTASKSLAPGLRLAWMVLPPDLAAEVAAHTDGGGWAVGALDQLTLAEFLTSGAYDRHVRASRLRYRRRRDQLVTALAERAPDVRPSGIAAGLHAVLRLPPGTEQSVIQAANWQRLGVQGLGWFRHPAAAGPHPDALVVGYGTPTERGWPGALEALCRVLP